MAQTKIGGLKLAAAAAGLTLEKYIARRDAGRKRCNICLKWKSDDSFNQDKSRGDGLYPSCKACQNLRSRRNYTPIPPDQQKPRGPSPIAERAGDKLQARATANRLKKRGKLPEPDDVPCFACGHIGMDRKHEFHHHNGYGAGHHTEVVAMCRSCHRTGDLNPKRIKKNNAKD